MLEPPAVIDIRPVSLLLRLPMQMHQAFVFALLTPHFERKRY